VKFLWFYQHSAGFPPWQPKFDPWSGHVGFLVDTMVLGQDFPEYFGFPCQSYSTYCSTFSNHPIIHHYIVSMLTVLLNNQLVTAPKIICHVLVITVLKVVYD
jgi:hypothetical protein